MSHTSYGTTKQEWLKQAGEIQDDVNRVLEDLQIEIEAANIVLKELYENEPDLVGEYVQNLTEYLDDRWGYNGDFFMVSGTWREPQVGMTDEGVLVRHREADALNVVKSNGFMTTLFEDGDNEVPQVGMSFITGSEIPISTPSIQGRFEALAFALPGNISLQYMRPGQLSTVSSELSEVIEALHRADALLDLYTNNENSSFYSQKAGKQEKFFQSLIDSIEDTLPAPDALDHLFIADAKTPTVYYKDVASSELYSVDTGVETMFELSGTVVGVTVADIVDNGHERQYSSPDELGASDDGLCLIVRPTDLDSGLKVCEDLDLLIPLRLIKELNLMLA